MSETREFSYLYGSGECEIARQDDGWVRVRSHTGIGATQWRPIERGDPGVDAEFAIVDLCDRLAADRAAAERREKAAQMAVGALARYGVHDYDCACAHEKCGTNPAIKHPPNCPNCDCGLRAALAAVVRESE